MTERGRDLLTGSMLAVLSVVWCAIVLRSIPAGAGGSDVGPRAFPLLLGLLLGICTLGILARAMRLPRSATAREPKEAKATLHSIAVLALTLVHIAAYGFLMQKIGFVLSTLLVVTSVMIFCVGERRPLRVAAMSGGITFVCWLLFSKFLGVYLSVGTWFNLG